MIFVDQLAQRRGSWRWGMSCHLVSDESVAELLDFAKSLKIPLTWYQPRSTPHFDLSPRLRTRAVAAGAVSVGRQEFVDAMRRLRARMSAAAPERS